MRCHKYVGWSLANVGDDELCPEGPDRPTGYFDFFFTIMRSALGDC